MDINYVEESFTSFSTWYVFLPQMLWDCKEQFDDTNNKFGELSWVDIKWQT